MRATCAIWLALFGALGCGEQHAFVGEGGLYAFAMTEATPPFLMSPRGDALYIVETRITLPLEPPTDAQLAMLGGTPAPPFARMPWVERGDYEIEVDWTLSNLEDQPVTAGITLNGFNEFNEYMPGANIVDDELVVDFAMWERLFELGPQERLSGTIREEELDEVAVDLATVVNGAPNSHLIVYFENQSALDPRAQPYIPAVIPGLTGFRLGIRSTGCGGVGCRIVLEATVRLRDVNGKVSDRNAAHWDVPMPALFAPVVPAEM